MREKAGGVDRDKRHRVEEIETVGIGNCGV